MNLNYNYTYAARRKRSKALEKQTIHEHTNLVITKRSNPVKEIYTEGVLMEKEELLKMQKEDRK
jgi:hypothetical protein